MTSADWFDHLVGLAEFVDKANARRWTALAKTKAGKRKLTNLLHHQFEPNIKMFIDCAVWDAEQVLTTLQDLGSPEQVYLIDDTESARSTVSLDEVVYDVVGCLGGQVIGCVPGRLAYYESGTPGVRMILRK